MKRILFLFFAAFLTLSLDAQTHSPLTITHLTGNIYIYTTWRKIDDGPYPSNSMYLVTKSGIVLFDTPWDTTQFQPFMDSLEARYHKKVLFSISTHFHADRTAALDFLKSKGVKTYSSKMTYDLCKVRHEKQAQYYFTKDTAFTIDGYTIEAFYPGPGHTQDNIVIWLPREKILYGACFVKSYATESIGFTDDADLKDWPASIRKVMAHCPNPVYVIPGHLDWQNNTSLQHTMDLLTKLGYK